MSEVERFDVPSMRSLTQGEQAVMGYEVVLASDYDALAAKLAMAEDAAAKGDAARLLRGARCTHILGSTPAPRTPASTMQRYASGAASLCATEVTGSSSAMCSATAPLT